MDETILFPSPNWFQVSGLAVSSDGWLAYGGPSKSLCVLEPLPANYKGVVEGNHRYKAHVLSRAHLDKIVSVDISPEWPEKRLVLTGSGNGSVKQWSLEQLNGTLKFKSTLSHDIHSHEKEEIVGVAYSNEVYAITVGAFGNIVKWDLNSNVVKTYNNILKTFKPSSMACSHHVPLNIAIGTKQGVLFVVDLTGAGSILYKVRSQDDEIMNVSWCPQYEIQIEKLLDDTKNSSLTGTQDKPTPKKYSASDRMEKIRQQRDPEDNNSSGLVKELPEDSFDTFEVVEEDDMFDVYKDHEADEFGHKKFVPEDVVVKIKEPQKEIDYLAECLKLKEDILNKKNEPEPTIESLVEKFDKASINSESKTESKRETETEVAACSKEEIRVESTSVSSMHVHKHLLATIGKQGMVRIWSKTGKLVGSCTLSSGSKNPQNRHRGMSWATLTWCKPDLLLIVDGKNQLVECNPLKIDCKNKLDTKVIHSLHKRGLHCIASNAWRKPTPEAPQAWTVAQDRTLACYNILEKKTTVHNTCGGFVYNIQMCPYDATKVAISVGDGAVRVWTAEESETEEGKLSFGHVTTYWQHVQGKVLTIAWHPTKENLLAFGTAEARVGLVDASGGERAARTLAAGAAGGVYSLGWGESSLFVAARGDLLAYSTSPDQPPTPIPVVLEGASWSVSAARARGPRLAVGSDSGGVAVIPATGGSPLAAAFPYNKIIHTIEWHPLQTSLSTEQSPHKNLIAVCSQDKANTVVILEYAEKADNSHELTVWKTLSGHTGSVLQVAWSPHHDLRLLSTAHDGTVRVWDVASGVCTSIFGGHDGVTLSAAWGAQPSRPHAVLSGGADCCLRLWDTRDHPADAYVETKPEVPKRDKKKKKDNKEKKQDTTEVAHESEDSDDNTVAATESKVKASKRFLLPTLSKEMAPKFRLKGAKRLLHKYLVKKGIEDPKEQEELNLDFIKIFGSTNEVNEVFEMELQRHLEFGNMEAWVVLNVFRGHIDAMMQVASEKGIICPYLLSIAPSVSAKYWKDASRMYLAQIDRLVANGEEEKLVANRSYGGPVYRKAVTLLSLQDVKAAVTTLCEARLFKEAYLLCRIRYIDTIADEVLLAWAKNAIHSGVPDMAAICYITLGNLLEAATVLGKNKDEDSLGVASDLARAAGQTILSDNLVERKSQIKADQTAELVDQLPSRIELLMKSIQENEKENCNGNENCDVKSE